MRAAPAEPERGEPGRARERPREVLEEAAQVEHGVPEQSTAPCHGIDRARSVRDN